MPTDLLTELTHEAADSNRRKADHVKAFAAGLGAEGAGADRRLTEFTVREAVAQAARSGADDLRRWGSTFELLGSAGGRASAKQILETAVRLFDSWQALEAETRRLVEAGARRGISASEQALRELDEVARGVAAAKAEAVAILAALDRPWPEIDAARLADGRKDAAEGRTMKSDEVIAAIRAARK